MEPLKTIAEEAVPAALERAKQYRLLNEPEQTESICLDILEVSPDSRETRILLLLALTDQFDARLTAAFQDAMDAAAQLEGAYERTYYQGVIFERRARAHFRCASPQCGNVAYGWFQKALEAYKEAEAQRPPGNDESLLRWNTCVRMMERYPSIEPELLDTTPQLLE